jgi:hypothetical protein
METSVPEDTLSFQDVDAPLPVMMRMREMPVTALLVAVAVVVVRVVADGQKTLVSAGLDNAASSDRSLDQCPLELHTVVHKVVPLARPLSAVSHSIPVVTIPPPVRSASVLQRTMTVTTSVEEGILHNRHWDSMPVIVVRVREVPPATKWKACAIIVCGVIANRLHLLRSAGFADVVCSHVTRDLDLVHSVLAHDDHIRDLWWLFDTEGVIMSIVVTTHPTVATACVLERSCMVDTSVKERANHLVPRDAVAVVMMRMREMPWAKRTALAISVMPVIHHGCKPLLLACIEYVLRIHWALHSDAMESEAGVFEVHLGVVHLWLGAHGIGILVSSMAPPVRPACIHQRSVTVVASVEEDARNLVHINAVLTVMVGVREVPVAAFLVAIAVVVVRVIAHRQHALLPAGLVNVGVIHDSIHLRPFERHTFVLHVVP